MTDVGDPIALLRRVRNVRRFRAEPVPEAAVADLLEVARWTGSARNQQPWDFVVVRDRAVLLALAAIAPNLAWMADAPLALVPVLAGKNAETETFDEGRLSERVMVAAGARGLGAGIGWFLSGAPREAARGLLGVPEGRVVRTVVAIGFEADDGPPRAGRPPGAAARARRPLAELVHVDHFGRRPD